MADYQVWALVGLVLLIAELFTPSFFIIFFGIGGIIVAVSSYIGLTPSHSSQLLAFSLSSIVLLVLFRNKIRLRVSSEAPTLSPDFIGQRVRVIKAIPAGEEGQVSYRGSAWIAFSEDDRDIKEGTMVEIIGNDGVRLKVRQVG